MVFNNRDVRFWQKVVLLMIGVAVLILFFFLPIFAIPLIDPSGVVTETTIKRSLFEEIMVQHFGG